MKKPYLLIIICCIQALTYAQVPRKLLPRAVNIPNKHNLAPSLSADGQTLIYLSTYSASEQPELKYIYKTGPESWSTPEDLGEVNKFLDLNYAGGYCLSADGKTIYFTSKRGQGIGEYDILYTTKQGGYWTPAQNLGKPVNSIGHDGAPSITPDGQYMYFMRCKNMSRYEASGCEIWVAERRNDVIWNQPVKLSSMINSGNEQFPKIFPDNNTLLFSSSRAGGKGGLDFYLSRKTGETWSKPMALDFINSDKDDIYACLTGKSDEIYFSTEYRGKEAIIVSQLPEEFQGQKVVLMEGQVVDAQTERPLKAFVQVYDALEQHRLLYARSDENTGKFYSVVPVEDVTDFSILTLDKGYFYEASLLYADSMQGSERKSEIFRMQKLRDGLTINTKNIRFLEYTSVLNDVSGLELKRILKVLKDNPSFNIELGIHINEIIRDSIQSQPDLTEMRVDTLFVFDEYINSASEEADRDMDADDDASDDFISMDDNNETLISDNDGGFVNMEDASFNDMDDEALDSLNNAINPPMVTKLKYTYHNDRTPRQADVLINYFLDNGVPSDRITAVGYGDQFNIVPKTASNSREVNNRVEIKFKER